MGFHIPSLSIEKRIDALKETSPKKFKFYNFLWRTVWLGYWFYIFLAIFIVIARFAPNFARAGGLIRGQFSIGYGAVIVIFLGSGLSMKTSELLKNMLHWRAHLTVFILQFLITSSIIYGFACAVKAANNPKMSNWMLMGLIVTGCCPTTVSSNVVMTRKADGNVLLTLCEVFLGNLAGAFITPALVQMYATGEWSFGNPANGNSIRVVYQNVMKQIGISVFVPLFVGQVIQNILPAQTKWFLVTFRFNKVGSFMLLLIMFHSFSTAFYQKAFTSVSHEAIIFVCFFNFGIYILFTVICYMMSRPTLLLKLVEKEPDENSTRFYVFFYKLLRPFYYNRADTVSVLLCGGAKTAALGVTLISSQYGHDNPHLGELLVPCVLYQAIQVLAAGLLTTYMKKWIHAGPEYKRKQLEIQQKQLEQQEQLQEQQQQQQSDEGRGNGSQSYEQNHSYQNDFEENNESNSDPLGNVSDHESDDIENSSKGSYIENVSSIKISQDSPQVFRSPSSLTKLHHHDKN